MINNKKILAIIPARNGSKRLPRKNILELASKPLIAWTIEAALNSDYIDQVLVSTDSHEIADIALAYGANIPFIRPSYLASDTSTSNDVILHCLDVIEESFDYVMLLQPTSPLRTTVHINKAIELLQNKQAEGIVSVCPCEHNPMWANTIPESGCLSDFLEVSPNTRSQDLPVFYRLNGAIYLFETKAFYYNKGVFYNEKVYSYVMSNKSSIDIDYEYDFNIAQAFIE